MDSAWSYKVENATNEAYTFVNFLDRSKLGEFACDIELLRYAVAEQMMTGYVAKMTDLGRIASANQRIGHIKVMLMDAATRGKNNRTTKGSAVDFDSIYGEALYWMGKNKLPTGFHSNNASLHVEHLKSVAASDASYHPYYRLGIWDKSAVTSFIKEDIDPQLALAAYLVGG